MEQLILRQAAIDALRTCYDTETITMDNGDEYINYGDAVGEIEQCPPIQPEIVRCKDCKHFESEYGYCDYYQWNMTDSNFCSKAERKEAKT